MSNNIVIGIEGQVSSGKTSICKELTNIMPNTIFVDGGSFYRGILEAIKRKKSNPIEFIKIVALVKKVLNGKEADVLEIIERLKVEFRIEDKISRIYIDGQRLEEKEIETMENSMDVSKFAPKANNEKFFKFARDIINKYKKEYNVIISGRGLWDIYPEMDYHFYITADIEERVERRYKQFNGLYSREEIKENIQKRDNMHKDAGYNKFEEKTIIVDVTECKSAEESARKVISKMSKEKENV